MSASAASSPIPVLLVLAGPAGSGKSTLCARLVREVPGFTRVVTATTRPPRPGEVNDVDYHFLTPEEFDAKVAAGEFLEWAWVHQKHRYGTLAAAVLEPLRRGQSLVINIDVQGVEHFRTAAAANPLLRRHLTTVFIEVSPATIRERLAGRGDKDTEEIARRLRTAEAELREKPKFDHVITSRSRDDDFQSLLAICQAARQRIAAQ
ncbi:MAG: AAA family ATPase [Opitutae bacterium]|nr:AAA family ATPase [Opitutae bacterium]